MIADDRALAAVQDAIEKLPFLCRRAFILVRYTGLDFQEAAAEMGLSASQVRRFVQRAFLSCQRALEASGALRDPLTIEGEVVSKRAQSSPIHREVERLPEIVSD